MFGYFSYNIKELNVQQKTCLQYFMSRLCFKQLHLRLINTDDETPQVNLFIIYTYFISKWTESKLNNCITTIAPGVNKSWDLTLKERNVNYTNQNDISALNKPAPAFIFCPTNSARRILL